MNDMTKAIIPKSDQLNSDDLIGCTKTITITSVDIRGGQEQPVSIFYDGDNGKPYKPCKSMCRAMVMAWGADASKYVGRSMTLYRDPTVTWAGMSVGGIRISHMSDIDDQIVMAITANKKSRKSVTVKPLQKNTSSPPPPHAPSKLAPAEDGAAVGEEPTALSPEQIARAKVQTAYDNAPSDVRTAFASTAKTPISEMSEKQANAAYKWITAAVDKANA